MDTTAVTVRSARTWYWVHEKEFCRCISIVIALTANRGPIFLQCLHIVLVLPLCRRLLFPPCTQNAAMQMFYEWRGHLLRQFRAQRTDVILHQFNVRLPTCWLLLCLCYVPILWDNFSLWREISPYFNIIPLIDTSLKHARPPHLKTTWSHFAVKLATSCNM